MLFKLLLNRFLLFSVAVLYDTLFGACANCSRLFLMALMVVFLKVSELVTTEIFRFQEC
ncbi:hypothetical protein JCM19302_214 [Jejuia pallidilutea]|uniref:Uncharacterized protein n=1 Tax=Jejuia pallidilutea TaxID=504487 RepID=A0A090WBN4_9FLAO|nr:hypothetical protein JCM19302_214 [Jejuia pallidilutea]